MSADPLAHWAAAQLGVASVDLTRHVGGVSRAGFWVTEPGSGAPLAFLRADVGDAGLSGSTYSLAREAGVLRRMRVEGLPVPTVIAESTAPAALLMEVVPGDARPDAATLEVVGEAYMGLVAKVHTLDPVQALGGAPRTTSDAVADDLAWWLDLAQHEGVAEAPLIRLAFDHLTATQPAIDSPARLVHGDVGVGNFMVDDGRISAVLDWELAHAGDPHEDLAWLWMRSAHSTFGDPHIRFAEYAKASGTAIDEHRLQWNLALVMLKSVITVRAKVAAAEADAGLLAVQVVLLTYEPLLAAALLRIDGEDLPLLTETPVRRPTAAARFVQTALDEPLSRAATVGLEFVRDALSQRAWEAERLDQDCAELLGGAALDLGVIHGADAATRRALIRVAGRAADRAAQATGKAVRRIERAQSVGLAS